MIEKGKATGAHLLSGANMRPSAMRELFPDLEPSDWPVYQEVTKDAVYLLTKKRALPLKPMPPNFRNHGNYVTSVAKLGRFLGEKAEEAGAYLLTETAADRLLVEDRIVRGVRSGDKGRGRDGEELANFEPGSDVVAKATVLAEGTQGHLTGAAIDYFDLQGHLPAALGARRQGDLGGREAPRPRHPHAGLAAAKARQVERVRRQLHLPDGRGQGQPRARGRARLHRRHLLRPRRPSAAQDATPSSRSILEGGKRVGWGAKTIPSGGYWSLPRKLSVPGMVICGDGAGMVNVPELKGIHYAMHAGMYAAETIVSSSSGTRSTSRTTTSASRRA